MDATFFVDIKSKWLRDAVRTVLKDVRAISAKEDKVSVSSCRLPTIWSQLLTWAQIEQNLLYNCLSELKSHRRGTVSPNQAYVAHLDLLINYIETTYADTTIRLLSLLMNGEITYDLLWALFKPNAIIFTTCHGTHKPRCMKYDFGEEKTTKSGSRYWSIECRYQDFDGKEFGNVSMELEIPRFRGG